MEELRGKRPDVFSANPAAEDIQQDIYATVSRGQTYSGEARTRRKDGSEFYCQFRVAPLYSASGEIIGYLGSQRDITDRKRAEEDTRRLRGELAHLDRVVTMGELAASLAHEINQPLTAILSNAQAAQRLLNKDNPDLEEVRDILADIISDDNRAGEVIRRLRSLFRKNELDLEYLNINSVVQEVISIMKSEAIIQNISIKVELDREIPPLPGDRVQLQQVIINFLMNASEAMADTDVGSRKVIISTSREDEQKVRISIRDYGTGIDEENLNRIFEPFYTTRPGGMGMGLSVNRAIIEVHGGRLWAGNNLDGGATFHLTLPTTNPSISGHRFSDMYK
jgi:two-component system sensor kinase FixL